MKSSIMIRLSRLSGELVPGITRVKIALCIKDARFYYFVLFLGLFIISSCNENTKLLSEIEKMESEFKETKQGLDPLLILLGTYYYTNPQDADMGIKYADYLELAGYARLSCNILEEINASGIGDIHDRMFRYAISAKNFELAARVDADRIPGYKDVIGEVDKLNFEIAQNIENPELFLKRGMLFYRMDELDAASWDLDRALNYDPNMSSGWLHKSLLLVKKGNNQAALLALQRFGFLPSTGEKDLINFAMELKAVVERLVVIDSLVARNPGNASLRLEKASLYGKIKEYDLAIKELNEIVRGEPRNAEAYAMRAYMHYLLEDFLQALEDVNKAEFLSGREGTVLKKKIQDALQNN